MADCSIIRGNRKVLKGLMKTKQGLLFGLRTIFSVNKLDHVKYNQGMQGLVTKKCI